MPIGVLTNCASVLAGGVIGSALGHILPASLKEHLASSRPAPNTHSRMTHCGSGMPEIVQLFRNSSTVSTSSFLNSGVYRLFGTPFGIAKHPIC